MRKQTHSKNPTPFFLITLLFLFLLLLLVSCQCFFLYTENKALQQQLSQRKETDAMNSISVTPITTDIPIVSPTPSKEKDFLSSLAAYSPGEIVDTALIDKENLSLYFTVNEIASETEDRIIGKSYRENPDITLDELGYIKLLHYNFEHQVQVGELIVNKRIAEDCIEIFTELFQAEYEIQSMHLIDNYWTGEGSSTDTASMNANNSSAFCYRTIAGTSKLSNHALGYAIDINPYQNPYITYKNGVPVFYHDNAQSYADRTTAQEHMITHDDLCYQLFTSHGFSWGGDWKNSKDYQHFEKTQ